MKFTFIIKHYEKIILAIVLGFFVLSLLWLIEVFSSIAKEKSTGIVLTANRATYKPIDYKSYSSLTSFKNSKSWVNSEKRNISPDDPDYILTFTDFMIPFKIARSNAAGAGNKLIPYIYYTNGVCPISGGKLFLAKETVVDTESLDTDKDGIPDSIEKKYNMNPKNPRDIYNDIDNDGFSNIQEYKYNQKGIGDKKTHPSLIGRLILIKVSNTVIPLILKKIIRRGDNKENWDIQINVKSTNRGWTTKFLKINDSVEINDDKYTIIDIKYKTDNVLDPQLGVVVEREISAIVLQDSRGEKITAQKNQQIYEQDQQITLKNLYTGKTILARIGTIITLGNKDIGLEKYKIVNVTNNNNSIEFEKNGKIFVVNEENDYKLPVKSTILFNNLPPQQKR